MSGPISQVDSGLSNAPQRPYRRPGTALGPHLNTHCLDLSNYFYFYFWLFRATPAAYGSFQARGQIRAVAEVPQPGQILATAATRATTVTIPDL